METTKTSPYQYAYDTKNNIWIVYANVDVPDTDFETGELLWGMSTVTIAECKSEKQARKIATAPPLEYYYEWGNEPRGFVTAGYYKDDVWHTHGHISKKDAVLLGLTFHNPNA